MKVNEESDCYTVRDLNRRTAEVLAAAAKYGSVTIRSRTGERFVLRPDAVAANGADRLAERVIEQRRRLQLLGYQAQPPEAWRRLDEIVAGEE